MVTNGYTTRLSMCVVKYTCYSLYLISSAQWSNGTILAYGAKGSEFESGRDYLRTISFLTYYKTSTLFESFLFFLCVCVCLTFNDNIIVILPGTGLYQLVY